VCANFIFISILRKLISFAKHKKSQMFHFTTTVCVHFMGKKYCTSSSSTQEWFWKNAKFKNLRNVDQELTYMW